MDWNPAAAPVAADYVPALGDPLRARFISIGSCGPGAGTSSPGDGADRA